MIGKVRLTAFAPTPLSSFVEATAVKKADSTYGAGPTHEAAERR